MVGERERERGMGKVRMVERDGRGAVEKRNGRAST